MKTQIPLLIASAALLGLPVLPLNAQIVNDGATNTLSNVTTNFTGDVIVGTNGLFTLLVISNNALLTNSANGIIGLNTTARSNEVRLVSPTSRWLMGGDLNVGQNGAFNRLVVSNGGLVGNFTGTVGSESFSGPLGNSNVAVVTGSGSLWTNAGNFYVGLFGVGNQLVVSNGGTVAGRFGIIGGSSGSNAAVVTGSGSAWRNSRDVWVGQSGHSNRLMVSNGGLVVSSNGILGLSVSRGNETIVTGSGSLWSNRLDLTVGSFASPGNRLVISNSGTVVANQLLIGADAGSTNNRVVVDGGTLRVTNLAGNGTLEVRHGANVLNAGLVEANRLVLTNAAGRFEFNGGTQFVGQSTIANGLSFDVGDSNSPATLNLTGNGTHSFSSNLIVRSNAIVMGNGTILAPIISAQAGSRISPGTAPGAIGRLSSSGSVELRGFSNMEISKSGGVLTNDQIQAADITYLGGLVIAIKIGPDALAAGDRFQLFLAGEYGLAGANFLPGLAPGLRWVNNLGVDGSIEVESLAPSVTTLPASALSPASATLNGTANPKGSNTTAWFEFGFTTNYGNVTPPQALGSGTSDTNFSEVLNGLFGGVTYHFRAVASNHFGVAFGTNQSFTLPVFTPTITNLTPVLAGSVAWGDFDNDGRLDILLTGDSEQGFQQHAELWRNTGSGFTNFGLIPPGVVDSSVAWGDYDNDGKLDILLTGQASDPLFHKIAKVLNLGSGVFDLPPGVFEGSVAWGDYDNDGRLDILLTGQADSFGNISQIWCNTGSGFTTNNAGLPGVAFGSSAWGDYDNDGRLDILLTGSGISQVWRNTGSGFTNINAGLPGVFESSVAWGDYDNDGRLDILLTGDNGTNAISQVWRNTGNGFTNINAGLPGVSRGSVAWGDYDNDGRRDILLTGHTGTTIISQVWRNMGSGFTNVNAGLPGVSSSSVAWGDYDNDGRLDILLTGSGANTISQVWRNNTPLTNTPPTAPTGLSITTGLSVANLGNTVILSWNASSDAQTPASGLTYNVRVGSTPGASDVMGPMASSNGFLRLPQMGNAQQRLFAIFNAALATTYYWSVQAVDTAFAGSPFAPEQSFTINTVLTPTNGIPVPGDLNGDGIMSQSELATVLANLNGSGILTEADLNLVLSNYFAASPWLYMTNVAGLGGTNVTFALTNSLAAAFSVEYTTNLVDWLFLGPATPRYLFTDTNAPAEPQRYYRLRWP